MDLTVSELTVVIQTLQELQRMHQLNLELLEQFNIFTEWAVKNNVDLPNKENLKSISHRIEALLKELYSTDTPQILLYQKISRRKVTDFKTDDKVTEPSLKPSAHSDMVFQLIRGFDRYNLQLCCA